MSLKTPERLLIKPGYAWQCKLKYAKFKLKTHGNIDILMFWERGIRGGISQCSNRSSEPNNKYMDWYNPQRPEKYISYFDANNLYGFGMSQPLPYELIPISILPVDSPVGYVLEVELTYLKHLHDED